LQEFTKAIVRGVPETLADGIAPEGLGRPDLGPSREQHARYVAALEGCGLEVLALEPDDAFPDCVFVEDTAVMAGGCAVITNPGAESRRGEVPAVARALSDLYEDVERIRAPGTLDGGDVLQAGEHFYVGLTGRTNEAGARQLADVLRERGYGVSFVEVRGFLHLKTGVSYLGGEDLLVAGELAEHEAFGGFDRILVPPEEAYCANCVRVNGRVLVPEGYEKTAAEVSGRGYDVLPLEMSEFWKLDGGLSCLSLRLE
jgi:dimethylargininase